MECPVNICHSISSLDVISSYRNEGHFAKRQETEFVELTVHVSHLKNNKDRQEGSLTFYTFREQLAKYFIATANITAKLRLLFNFIDQSTSLCTHRCVVTRVQWN
jgi:hypothetical protein